LQTIVCVMFMLGVSIVMLGRRKDELELYKLFASDAAFKASWEDSLQRLVG